MSTNNNPVKDINKVEIDGYYAEDISPEIRRGLLKKEFAEIDTNKDGSVTRQELFYYLDKRNVRASII